MRKIFKYGPIGHGKNAIRMPANARILTAQFQASTWGEHLHLWALVDPDEAEVVRRFTIYGTGHEIEGNLGTYIATVQTGGFVWHLFEEVEK